MVFIRKAVVTSKNILFLNGLPDNALVTVNFIDKNNTMYYNLKGSCNIAQAMNNNYIVPSTLVFDTHLKQDINVASNIHAIFNEISDADTHLVTLAKAQKLYNIFAEKIPFFNIPNHIMRTTRSNIYKLLHDIDGLHVPKTVKIQPKSAYDIYDAIAREGLEFPLIFRRAGDHNGVSTTLIEDASEQFYAFALNGENHYLTQFVDNSNRDGIYAKYRLAVVDGEVFIRHVLFDNDRIVHNRAYMEENEKYRKKENEILNSFNKIIKPKIQTTIKEIHHRLGLDYFGIDCNIDDDYTITLFEANASMDMLTDRHKNEHSLLTDKIQEIKNAIVKMLNSKTI